ncbi:MAG TPA: DUF4153 domain-containing protein [Burkholderiales bacterium]|nr:DUF4153 domain-containing protein [Burkholderiales bacterium]
MSELPDRTRNTLIALGVMQGLLLLVGHLLFKHDVWRMANNAVQFMPWFAVAAAVPVALQLALIDVRDRRVWLFGLALAVVLALTGVYAGYSAEPSQGISGDGIAAYVIPTLIGCYVLLPFVQASFKTGHWRPAYPDLFEFAWNNGITLLIAKIFTAIFWALLSLWAALFKVIGIGFFAEIFYSAYFAYPVTAMVFAFAIYLGRNNVNAVVTVRRIVLAVFKALLPLLAVISLLFLAALPVMGLKPLWDTGKATALMLCLQILMMIFLNAVFQNGRGDPPYPNWLRKLLQAAVALLPIYAALCAYALYLRIDQHGWSTDRFWAVLLAFVVALHGLGYAIGAVRRQKTWMADIATVNIAIAALIVALSVAVNSPLLDAKRISAASQTNRLLAGKVSTDKFDYRYLRFELGRYGNAALARLKDVADHPQAEQVRSSATFALNQTNRWNLYQQTNIGTAQAATHFSVFPKSETLDESFLPYVTDALTSGIVKSCLENSKRCPILVLDLNRDRQKEYIVFHPAARSAAVLTKTDNRWRPIGFLSIESKWKNVKELEDRLAKGDYAAVENPWQNLRIGRQTERLRLE